MTADPHDMENIVNSDIGGGNSIIYMTRSGKTIAHDGLTVCSLSEDEENAIAAVIASPTGELEEPDDED